MTETRAPEAEAAREPEPTPGARTHFGYGEVDLDKKPSLIRGVFESVASRYDLMNDLMSMRIHRLWKEAMLDWLAPRKNAVMLDLAGGTGDIALRALRRTGGLLDVTVVDLTPGMLLEGRRRFAEIGVQAPVKWLCADATALPFADKSVDYVTMAFGVRNVAEPEKALAEAYRVLKPGGRFLCLEFSRVRNPGLRRLYDLYSFSVIPAVGMVVTGDRDSYQYLVESIRRFPDQERFKAMIEAAGFGRVAVRDMSGGVVALHSGWRI